MYNLNLTPEQIEFRDTIADFARSRIKPAAIHPDHLEPFAKPLLMDLLDEASSLGIRSLLVSEEAGGIGADGLTACLIFEELSAGDVDIAVTLANTALAAKLLFDQLMTPDQKKKYLLPFIDDEQFHLAFACDGSQNRSGWNYHQPPTSEATSQLTVQQAGSGWRVDGRLTDVVNADVAKLIALWVPDHGIFLLPRGTEGLKLDSKNDPFARTTSSKETAVSWSHGVVSDCVFDDCRLDTDQCITPTSGNVQSIQELLQGTILVQAAIQLGIAKIALETAVEYAKLRRQGGRNIVEHQAIGTKIADMTIKLESTRAMVWKAAWVSDHPEAIADRSLPNLPYTVMAQTLVADSVNEITLLAAEFFGAMGVMRDMPLQKYVNDSFIFTSSNGLDSATKLLVAEAVADYRDE